MSLETPRFGIPDVAVAAWSTADPLAGLKDLLATTHRTIADLIPFDG